MKTRVAKIVSEGRVEIFHQEVTPLLDGEVLIQLKSVGICGSDLHYFRHCGLGSFKNPLPIDIGHEPSGLVLESKSELFNFGDKVAIEPGKNCGKCKYCYRGQFNLCTGTKFLGANDVGAFRDYIVLDESRLMKVETSYDKAALLEPLGVALHAFDRVKTNLGDSIAIFGAGTIGLCILSVLKKAGCKVTMFDPLQNRLDFAKNYLSADNIIINNPDIRLSEFKNQFQIAFDAVGNQDSIDKCTVVTEAGGQVCIVGIPEVDYLTVNPHLMRLKEMTLVNSRRSNQKLEQAYHLFKDHLSIERLVTHKFKLEDIQKAFEISSNYEDNVIKIMVKDNSDDI